MFDVDRSQSVFLRVLSLAAGCVLALSMTATAFAQGGGGNSADPSSAQPAASAQQTAQPAAPVQQPAQPRAEKMPMRAEVNAPVKNFRLPVFDEAGHRVWDLLGVEARYLDRNDIRVADMTLRTYVKEDPTNPRMLIQSPTANIRPQDNVAEGPGYIYITEANNNYFIIGSEWVWDGKAQRVRIGKGVRVTFREKIDRVLN